MAERVVDAVDGAEAALLPSSSHGERRNGGVGTSGHPGTHTDSESEMALAYIRGAYRVPAHIGQRVEFGDVSGNIGGTIVGGIDAHLLVEFDGADGLQSVLHPIWHVHYPKRVSS